MRDANCLLVLRNHGKPIPYHAVDRGNGEQNHGFRPLKGRSSSEIRAVAEVADHPGLADFLEHMNDAESAFFTVGCEKALNEDSYGWWGNGYVEFAFNAVELAGDAQNYFKLFFDFNQRIWEPDFKLREQYGWELEGAHFDSTNSSGFTAAVWIRTDRFPAMDDARDAWSTALALLDEFLSSYQGEARWTRIY